MSSLQAHTRNGFSIYQCKAETDCYKSIHNTSSVAKRIKKLVTELNLDEFIRNKFGDRLSKHHVFDIVFSGCPNGCSKPQINDIGIMGRSIIAINQAECISCMKCIRACKENALKIVESAVIVDDKACVGCSECVRACPVDAIIETNKGYRVIAGGRLGRHPQLALEVVPFVNEAELDSVVRGLIEYFKEYATTEERLADTIARLGIESVQQYLQKNYLQKNTEEQSA
ncbi:4Fe-4S dicluster-binding protein [Desulfuribacillus alkaliarsenatis]|uniref:4Fe-4S ferredoxin-type domain-containing protein n=1 Tax=Desulfuribacillus alkaliarsenatis TaxID=766136 RepID=A0A1E5G235_9FIRM|nr:4Fe-4S dicluster domain-containing protein [Desulfuribacillus alkaliarsenatis]OEF97039.1 hypothetical protein BHF68_05420 [Desulfuribacillus alkaliarsenatis]